MPGSENSIKIPAVTIQILGWNSVLDLEETLPVYAAMPRELVMVRYVDNGSTDNSIAVVRRLLPDADIIQLPRNIGYAGGHNAGLTKCTTPYIILVNPDTRLTWRSIPTIVTEFERDARLGAAQGLLWRDQKQSVVDSAGIVLTLAYNGHERGAGEAAAAYQEPADIIAPTGAGAFYRLAALRDVAYSPIEFFDADFFAYKEDVDLGWRLTKHGWRVRYFPIPMGSHVRHLRQEGKLGLPLGWTSLQRRLRDPRTRYSIRNWVWLLGKHVPWYQWLWRAPFIVGRILAWLLVSLLYPPLLSIWIESLVALPRLRAKERSV